MKTNKLREYGLFNSDFPEGTVWKTVIFDRPITVKGSEALRVNMQTREAVVVQLKDLCCDPQHADYMQPRSECQYCKE